MSPDGKKVDVAATEALLKGTADPSKAGVADRHERERIERDVTAHITPSAPPAYQQIGDDGAPIDFQKARARREHYLARLAENESKKSDGDLAERATVEEAAFAAGRLLRDLLLGLPKQVSAELAAIDDPWALEKHLTSAIRRALEDATRLSVDDLKQAMLGEG